MLDGISKMLDGLGYNLGARTENTTQVCCATVIDVTHIRIVVAAVSAIFAAHSGRCDIEITMVLLN